MERIWFTILGAAGLTFLAAVPSVDSVSKIADSKVETASAYNNGRKIVRKDINTLYAVAMPQTYDFDLFESTNNGASWSPAFGFHAQLAEHPHSPSIALDSGGRPHVVYIALSGPPFANEVLHQWWDGLQWREELVSSQDVSDCAQQPLTVYFNPSITIDQISGTVHIAWEYSRSFPACISSAGRLLYWNDQNPSRVEIIIASNEPGRFQFPSIALERTSGIPIPMVIYQDNNPPPYQGEPSNVPMVLQKKRDPLDEVWKGCFEGEWCIVVPAFVCSLVSRFTDGGVHPFLDEETDKHQAIWESPSNSGIYHAFYLRCPGPNCLNWEWHCLGSQPYLVDNQGDDNVHPAVDGTFAVWSKKTGSEWEIWHAQFISGNWTNHTTNQSIIV